MSTIKIKAPAMPVGYPLFLREDGSQVFAFSQKQLDHRDAQWKEMVGPVVEALKLAMAGYTEFSAGDREVLCKCRAALSAITEE